MRIETFTFTPAFMGFFAAIFQAILISTFIYESDYRGNKKWKSLTFDGTMHFGFGAFFMFGVIFLETSIFWLGGQFAYLDWQYSLITVIILMVLGVEYIVGTMLTKPTYLEIAFSVISTIVVLVLLHAYVPYSTPMRTGLYITLGVMIAIIVLYCILWGRGVFRTKEPSWSQKTRFFWDFNKKFRTIFTRKVNIALYLITMTNAILNLFGSSIIIVFVDLLNLISLFS